MRVSKWHTVIAVGTMALSTIICGAQASEWVGKNVQKEESRITGADCAYLAEWLSAHSKPADRYMVDLFRTHQVVIYGESHNVREHKEFITGLVPSLYREAGVRCIGWEFSRKTDNALLRRLVTSSRFDARAALGFARSQSAHEWNSRDHWDIIRAVWQLNRNLRPGEQRMRLIGLPPKIDWVQYWMDASKPRTSLAFQRCLSIPFDQGMAATVEEEIIAKGIRGLVFCGQGHDTAQIAGQTYEGIDRPIMAGLLYAKYGSRVFQVRPYSEYPSFMERVMARLGDRPTGFDICGTPLAPVMLFGTKDDAGVSFGRLTQGFVYLAPRAKLHANTTIRGFVTAGMFRRYRKCYETSLGRKFRDAQDVDLYLRKHRWSAP